MSLVSRSRQWLLGVSSREVLLVPLGLQGEQDGIHAQIHPVVQAFLEGYHSALGVDQPGFLAAQLDSVPDQFRGFAFEGAGLGLTILDFLTPWRHTRFQEFVRGPGKRHDYMMHVGAGLALGRLPLRPSTLLKRLDPFLRWAAPDGYGFYMGATRRPIHVEKQEVPRRLTGYARRVFDVGLGRSLWFTDGAEVGRLAATVASFPASRQADLWSGIGIACSYTGWVELRSVEALREAAGPYRPQLAQGATISARARERAGNPTIETDQACRVLCSLSSKDAAGVAAAALKDLPADSVVPAFELWRQRVQAYFVKAGGETTLSQTDSLWRKTMRTG